MEKEISKLNALIQMGEQFNYDNFAPKSEHGFPCALTPEWIAWVARVHNAIAKLFGPHSSPMRQLNEASKIDLIGWGKDKFEAAKSYLLGALHASREILVEGDMFEELETNSRDNTSSTNHSIDAKKVFVVHGHDDASKSELEILLRDIGLEPIVLHRQPDHGKTIIEKFEKYSDVGYAFVLLTPDDVAFPASEVDLPFPKRTLENRARPNVIFEFGYFVGKLGRSNVCCLCTGKVTLPSDASGIIYKRFEKSIEEIGYSIIKELKARGYKLH